MIWNGKALTTIGDIMDTMMQIMNTNKELDAKEFMEAYKLENPNAEVNIGYLTGYFREKDMLKAQKYFGVKHPIFGDTAPTALEAFKIGTKMGVRSRKLNKDEDDFISELEKI